MDTKYTTANGDISLAATWGGSLPGSGDDAVVEHVCTISGSESFTAATLDLTGGSLAVSGTPGITANILGLENLSDGSATGLVITGNAGATAAHHWASHGRTHITGTLTINNASGTGIALNVYGTLQVDGGVSVTATAGNTAIFVQSGATLTANCQGYASSGGWAISLAGTIAGNCVGSSSGAAGGISISSGGQITGNCSATSASGTPLLINGTLAGDILVTENATSAQIEIGTGTWTAADGTSPGKVRSLLGTIEPRRWDRVHDGRCGPASARPGPGAFGDRPRRRRLGLAHRALAGRCAAWRQRGRCHGSLLCARCQPGRVGRRGRT